MARLVNDSSGGLMRHARVLFGPAADARGGALGGIVATLLVVVVAAVCIRLGLWQLERLEQRRAYNTALQTALALPPLQLDAGTVGALARDPDAYLYRRVRVRGVYQPEGEVVLRGRAHSGQPGVHLVTPLRIPDAGAAVLVNRGWAASPDAVTIDPRPLGEPGVQEIEGILQAMPLPEDGGAPVLIEVNGAAVFTLRRLEPALLQTRSADPLLPLYIQQLPTADAPGTLSRLPYPELTEGSHLGYALQWFTFAGIAVLGLLVVAVRRGTGNP